jgi:hypothetical protein
MSVGAWLGLGVCVAFLLAGPFIVRRVWTNEWRGRTFDPDVVPEYWIFGDAMWRGWFRLAFLGYLVVSLFGIAGLLWVVGDETLDLVGGYAAALAILLMVFIVPIVLFNRPKFLVLPWLRDQPGAIAEWRGAEVPPTPPAGTGLRRTTSGR